MNNNRKFFLGFAASLLCSFSLLITAAFPVLAHHPNGGAIPRNFTEGFLSGLGHPVIGIDHLVFVVAIGLLAALSFKRGIIMPAIFVIATALGTGIHLQGVNLPMPELVIAASVLVIGIFLTQKNQASLILLAVISAIAGIFHGYAYGESIVGAETTALGAYLLGFCGIQLAISAIAYYCGSKIVNQSSKSTLLLRFAGLIISGIGFAFVSNLILS
ncbi:MAG: HupE/UreJ family protein [Cyanobacteria bacterium P01_A01_bin.40]